MKQYRHTQLNDLNLRLGGNISKFEDDRLLQFQNCNGQGKVVSVSLEVGVSYTEYTLKLKDGLSFEVGKQLDSALYFIYCLKGNVCYHWGNEEIRNRTILELQTVILGTKLNSLHFSVPKGAETRFAIIKVKKNNYQKGQVPQDIPLDQKLFQKFFFQNEEETFEYHGSFNLQIREQLLQIAKIKQTGLVRKLLIESIIRYSLALELLHYNQDSLKDKKVRTRLTKQELLRVQNAIDMIARHPQKAYTVSSLCREYGLSPAKLQEGFKALEQCTIANYIKRERVEMAERLLQGGDLNISEVVYSIGFTSRSYFSKIFKKRYNCTPKYYQEHCKHFTTA